MLHQDYLFLFVLISGVYLLLQMYYTGGGHLWRH